MNKTISPKKRDKKNVFLESLIRNMPGHVYWKDLNGIFLGCNYEQAKSSGFASPEEIIGKSAYDILPKKDAVRVRKIDLEVMLSGKTHIIEERTSHYGRKKSIWLSQKIPLKNEQGNIIGIFGISFDITSYKKEQKNLKNQAEEAEIKFETLIAKMPGHVYWKDCGGVYLGCNEQQAKSLNLPFRNKIIGKTDYDLSPAEKADAFRIIDMEVMTTKKGYTAEEIILLANGKEATVLSQKVPLIDKKGKVTGILGISFDITDRKIAEARLKEALEAKANFMALVNHELLEPISNIMGMIDILKPSLENKPELSQFLDIANTEALRSLQLLKNATTLLELDNGMLEQKQYEVDIQHDLQRLLDITSVNDCVKKKLVTDKTVPEIIWIDVLNLDKVLQILLENAARFTTQGGITIKVKGNGKYLSICVEDTGIGIETAQQENLFSPALTNIEQRYKKAGVRLPIAQKLMTLIGGTLDVSSKVGKGTKITVTVPYRESENKRRFQDKQQRSKPEKTIVIPPLNILMVEDNPVAMMAQSTMLKKIGCRITPATTGLEAIQKVKSGHFDLVFLDIILPDIPGFEVAKQIHALNKNLDIVAITCRAEEMDIDNFIEHNIVAILPKPVSLKGLTDFLRSYVRAMREQED